MNKLNGKSIYAFGDSIIFGHTEPEHSFLKITAEKNNMNLSVYAVNGATVIKNDDNDIFMQINKAVQSETEPDFIVFDGYTNDAYDNVLSRLGSISSDTTGDFETSTFCGAFEKIINIMKDKWNSAALVYITVHKNAGRKWDVQCKLRELALKICSKYNVEVVDVFEKSDLDTRDDEQMRKYIIDGAGSHPNAEACKKFYVPLVEEKLMQLCQ